MQISNNESKTVLNEPCLGTIFDVFDEIITTADYFEFQEPQFFFALFKEQHPLNSCAIRSALSFLTVSIIF